MNPIFIIIFLILSKCPVKAQRPRTPYKASFSKELPNALKWQKFTGLYKGYSNYLAKIPDSIYANFYFKAKTSKKIVTLTFDDGPLRNTASIISFLKKEKIPATFFLVGKNVNSDNVKLYNNSLFTVGIHTYNHDNYRKLSYGDKVNDLNRCLKLFRTNKLKTTYFRPAYGIIDNDIKTIIKKNNLKGIIWSIDSQDWNGFKGDKMVSNIEQHLENGSIILFHDRISTEDLKNTINMIQNKGYRIVSLKKIMSYKNDIPK